MTSPAVLYDPAPDTDAAFVVFLAAHGGVAHGVAARRLRSVHDREDVCQQAAIAHLLRWRGGDAALDPALLTTISKGAAVDLLRSPEKRQMIPLADPSTLCAVPPDAADDPATVAANRDEVRRLLAPLDAEDRLLVYLRAGLRYRFAELADLLGGTEGALRQRYKRVKDTLAASAGAAPIVALLGALGRAWRSARQGGRSVVAAPAVNAAAWGLFMATVAVMPAPPARRRPQANVVERWRTVLVAGPPRPPARAAQRAPARPDPAPLVHDGRRTPSPTPIPAPRRLPVAPVLRDPPAVCVQGAVECQRRMPGHYIVVDVIPGRRVDVGQPYVAVCDYAPQAPPYVTCSREP